MYTCSSDFYLKTEFPQTMSVTWCETCPIEQEFGNRSSEFDYRLFVNQTFDCARLAKFYCEFAYVQLSSAMKPLGSITELFD